MLAGTERSPSETAAPDPSKNGGAAGPARTLGEHAAAIAALVSRLMRVRAARRRLWVSRTLFLVLGALVLAAVIVAASLAGVRLAVSGLTGGLTAVLDGRPWLAELCSGLLVLLCIALLLASIHRWLQRRVLRGLERDQGGGHASS
jgi:uncharacterized BrkB/YihY/UPF0761 family membrane protein